MLIKRHINDIRSKLDLGEKHTYSHESITSFYICSVALLEPHVFIWDGYSSRYDFFGNCENMCRTCWQHKYVHGEPENSKKFQRNLVKVTKMEPPLSTLGDLLYTHINVFM